MEEKGECKVKMERNFKVITTSISKEFYNMAREHGISWHQAISRGIRMICDGMNYEQELQRQKEALVNLNRKVLIMSGENEELRKQIQEMKDGKEVPG